MVDPEVPSSLAVPQASPLWENGFAVIFQSRKQSLVIGQYNRGSPSFSVMA